MKTILIIASIIMASILGFLAVKGTKDNKDKPTITLTQKQFMAVYYNGWLRGNLSMLSNNDLDTLFTWKKDSIEIQNMFANMYK